MKLEKKTADNRETKVALWKEINSYINDIEGRYSFFYTIFVAFLGSVFALTDGSFVSEKLGDTNFFLLLFIPVSIFVIMTYLVYNFRMVAVARMYASALEKSINEDLGEGVFTWNSDIIGKYVAKKNFANQWLFPLVNLCFFCVVSGVLIYSIYNSLWIPRIYCHLYHAAIIGFAIASVLFLMGNEKVRTSEYDLEKVYRENIAKKQKHHYKNIAVVRRRK